MILRNTLSAVSVAACKRGLNSHISAYADYE